VCVWPSVIEFDRGGRCLPAGLVVVVVDAAVLCRRCVRRQAVRCRAVLPPRCRARALLAALPVCVYTSRTHTHTHTRLTALFSGTARVSRYRKVKTNPDFTEARDSEWQWHQLGHMQVCTLLKTNNHASTPPLSILQAGCPSCRPTNSVEALYTRHTQCLFCSR